MPKYYVKNEYYCVVEADNEDEVYDVMQTVIDNNLYDTIRQKQTFIKKDTLCEGVQVVKAIPSFPIQTKEGKEIKVCYNETEIYIYDEEE